jgi:hypothetical protein
MPTKYYRIRGRAITLREYWRLCPDPFTFCIAAVAKPFGGLAPAWSVPFIDRMPIVHPDDLPRVVARAIERHSARFEDEGYRVLYHTEAPLLEKNRLVASSILLADDGWSLAQVLYIKNGEQTQVGLTVGCLCDDGTYAVTTNRKQELDSPPGHRVERYVGADAGRLVDKFHDHAREWEERDGMRPVPLDEAKVTELLLRVEREALEFHAARGVLVPMTRRELERLGVDSDDID